MLNKKLSGYQIFNGETYLVIFWAIFFLAQIDNGLGWGMQYKVDITEHIEKYIIYTLAFIFGLFISNIYSSRKDIKNVQDLKIGEQKLYFVCVVALAFMLLKFINIRDIPFLGNSMSRYSYTLGGFPDYPTRLFPILSIAFFSLYQQCKNKKYILMCCLMTMMPLLMLQRQDVVICILGIIIFALAKQSLSIGKLFKYTTLIVGALFLIIGGGVILRYGSDNISTGVMPLWEVALWAMHGDIAAASLFGAHVCESMREFYNGLYSFSGYFAIFNIADGGGADLMREQFTEQSTAQSIGIPFSFYVDFGYWGIAIMSFFSAFVLNRLKYLTVHTNSVYYKILYALFILELLWSLRSGSMPFRTIFVYQFLCLSFIFLEKRSLQYYLVKLGVIFSIFLSLSFALIRL